ncbi:MAG TPA: chemotaxis protein CheR [Ruminiclostridium sp.]|jgi:chemotaxis protein methyltransferase CheR|nr:protein-glutamate O-methyltransferase CheR [Clostridiaceae bacterium]HAA25873.1 chemotaxis protein CheR [Ruminiclostridium sp.]
MTDYEEFKNAFYKQSGIDLNLYKEKQMKRRITSLVERNGHSRFMSFFFAMQNDKELYNSFINYLTINVSEFYRNPTQWELFEKSMIPMLEKLKGDLQNVKIWSSACSTGDEPYTIVMILSKYLPLSKIRIIATDIDMSAIEKAKQGIYSDRSIKDLPDEFLKKYFKKIGDNSYKIIDEVKNCVNFSQLNLLEYDYPQNMDLIVCRNVLIYFTEEAKVNIYKAFNRSLVHGGILFLGSTEQIIGSIKYGLKPIQTFFYQKVKNIE